MEIGAYNCFQLSSICITSIVLQLLLIFFLTTTLGSVSGLLLLPTHDTCGIISLEMSFLGFVHDTVVYDGNNELYRVQTLFKSGA